MISLFLILLLLVPLFFFPPANNIETENSVVKNELASENLDNGKSILGAPPKQDKKEAKTLGLIRETLKSQKKKKAAFLSSL